MKKTKKLLAFLLALTLVFTTFATTVLAVDEGNATITIAADDKYTLFVNGSQIGERPVPINKDNREWEHTEEYTVTLEGDYVIAVMAEDLFGSIAGLSIMVEIDGQGSFDISDSGWRQTTDDVSNSGWTVKGYSMSDWSTVTMLGNDTHRSWASGAGAWGWSDNYSVEIDTPVYFRYEYVVPTIYYTVTTESADDSQGSTSPSETTVEAGTSVTVEASALDGYEFDYWAEKSEEGDIIIVGAAASYTFSVTRNIDLVAYFKAETPVVPPVDPPTPPTPPTPTPTVYTLTVNVEGNGSVPGFEGVNSFTSGTNVNLGALSDDDALYEFVGWTGDAAGDATDIVVVMNGNKTVTAVFDEIVEEIIEEDEEIPEAAPIEEETVEVLDEEILDEETPLADGVDLPQTSGVAAVALYALGAGLAGTGIVMKRRKK